MTLNYENEQSLALPFSVEELAKTVIEEVLLTEGCPFETEVSLTLTDNEEIHRINKEFRHIDRATDVLSFPMIPDSAPLDYDALEDTADIFDPDSGELLLGDIVISVERAYEQAEEYGHSVRREIAFLIAHSTLHLLGYDHMVPDEAAVMEQKQHAVLERLGITRDSN